MKKVGILVAVFLESETESHSDPMTTATRHGHSLIAAPDKVEADVQAKVLVDSEIEAYLAIQIGK